MTDGLGRTIDYLRLSVTDRCNLRCRYCMPTDLPFVPHADILRYEELLRICRCAAALGICHFKVTGGEPLLRKGCVDFMARLKDMPGAASVTLTTNGILLPAHLPALAAMKLDGVNISLDTLDSEQYRRITGSDSLPQVLDGLHGAIDLGLRVKINCVPLPETAPEQLLALASLSRTLPVDVRFIELMPIGSGKDVPPPPPFALLEQSVLHTWPDLAATQARRGFGPARYYTAAGQPGAIGFIDAISHCFCAGCNRIRLTSTGTLRPCLSHSGGVDLRALLRGGADDAALTAALRSAIFAKPAHHSFERFPGVESRSMSQIGG